MNKLTNWKWFSVVCTLTSNDMRHHSGQNVVDYKFWPLWWRVPLLIRVQTTLNHIQFVFYHNINLKENGFFRARAEKGIAWHIDASSVVWTLIDNSKLANQIARLVAIVEKKEFVNNIKNTPSYRK